MPKGTQRQQTPSLLFVRKLRPEFCPKCSIANNNGDHTGAWPCSAQARGDISTWRNRFCCRRLWTTSNCTSQSSSEEQKQLYNMHTHVYICVNECMYIGPCIWKVYMILEKIQVSKNSDFRTGSPVGIMYFANCLWVCLHAGYLEC